MSIESSSAQTTSVFIFWRSVSSVFTRVLRKCSYTQFGWILRTLTHPPPPQYKLLASDSSFGLLTVPLNYRLFQRLPVAGCATVSLHPFITFVPHSVTFCAFFHPYPYCLSVKCRSFSVGLTSLHVLSTWWIWEKVSVCAVRIAELTKKDALILTKAKKDKDGAACSWTGLFGSRFSMLQFNSMDLQHHLSPC